ncbi:hypothetical protein GIB67_040807 [Kingdonia uniflora]|uniref:RRM domain-containing protein n=1 Tax=Kingdonia uniflora TaxID=39325 RepID=A0A7J7P5A9_9MAGN|nr:hypothetical protein GIB67_040807 [Kingdonia uniflora]
MDIENETTNHQDTEEEMEMGLLHQHISIRDQSPDSDCVNSRGYDADTISLHHQQRRKPSDDISARARRLYVGNLLYNINEDQLRQVFEPFGDIELVQLPLQQETGLCKGFGFVQFVRLQDARAAQILNGQLDIGGRVIKVSAVSAHVGMQDIGAYTADYDDDDEGGGISFNARSRDILMQKLDCSETASLGSPDVSGLPVSPVLGFAPTFSLVVGQTSLPVALAGFPNPSVTFNVIGDPSECLMLQNMFDPKSEVVVLALSSSLTFIQTGLLVEPDFYLDIEEDVQDECSKFGEVKHIHVDKDSAGHVYLQFENTKAASDAQRALHGRWFAGKMVTAVFMVSLSQTCSNRLHDS